MENINDKNPNYIINKNANSSTNIPIDIPFDENLHTFYNEPLPENMPEPSHERPGFFRTLAGSFAQQFEITALAEKASRLQQDQSPLDDFVDPNWKPTDDKSALIGLDERNMGYVLSATGPKDQRRRYNYALEQQEYNERLSNGSMIAQLVGGGTGFAFSPSSALMFTRMALRAKVAQGFLQDFPKMVAGVAVSSTAHEAVIESSKIGANLSDWAINTFVDTVMATAFMGAHLGYSYAAEAQKLFNARGVLNLINKGVEARPVINEKGIVTGYKATAVDSSVGAAEVDIAQVYLDAALSKNFLYNIPYIGEQVGSKLGASSAWLAGIISPKVRMANSSFSTIRGFFNNYAEHSFDTVGIEQGRAIETPFETFMNIIRGTNVTLKTQYDGLFLKYNGIEYTEKTFSRTKANVLGKKEELLSDNFKSREEFGRAVQEAIITESPSANASVNEAAQLLREGMDPLYLEYLKLHGISDKILKPRGTKGFLHRVYNAARMELEEDQWIKDISNELQRNDQEILNLTQPIKNLRDEIKQSESKHAELIRTTEQKKPSSKDLKDEEDLNEKIKPIQDRLNKANAQFRKAKKPETKAKHQEKIDEINKELNPLKEKLDSIKSKMYSGDIAIKKSSDAIEVMRKKATRMEEDLQNLLRENEDLDIFLSDRNAVSANEAKAIVNYLTPLNKLETELQKQQAIVSSLKAQKTEKKQAAQKGKTAETAKKHAESENLLIKQIESEEAKLSELKDKFDIESENLQEKMHTNQIPQELFYKIPESNRYQFKDPSNRLKMRDVYESDFHRQVAAKSYYDSILNQTAEDNIRNIMNKVMGTERENPLVERTLMLRDKFLHDYKWLHPDPAINVMNYRNFIGRQNSIKKILDRLTINGTFDELINRFAQEYTERKTAIPKDLPKAKYEKAVKKLGAEYKKNKEDLQLTIGQMTNKSRYSAKGREYSRMANLYAVATKLGFLPLTMSTDNMAIVFKHGFWPAIKDGLFPMLKTLGGMLNTADAKVVRENAAHAHVAEMHVNMAYTDKNWTGTSQTYEPVQGKLMTGLETLAHYSSNFTLANYVENYNQRVTAFIVNSKIMKAMKDFLEGNLKPTDRNYKDLLKYGIDPKKFAEIFRKEWEAGGKYGNGFGGDIGKYWEWADKEASNAMSTAILRAVKDTIIRRGYLDAPFAMDNPLINSIFLFKGYVLASMTRFLAPLMQAPDARKLIGTALMMTAGSTQNPLRRLAAGKDPMEEEDHMFRNAVRDGGVFSILGDVYEEANFLTNGFLQETVTNERYRGRTEMGVFNGPVGAMANDMTRIIGMVASREWNQTDLKRIAVNTPFLYSWQLRASVNKWIENTELPKTRAKARQANAV